jgi:hypothetical protein
MNSATTTATLEGNWFYTDLVQFRFKTPAEQRAEDRAWMAAAPPDNQAGHHVRRACWLVPNCSMPEDTVWEIEEQQLQNPALGPEWDPVRKVHELYAWSLSLKELILRAKNEDFDESDLPDPLHWVVR